jgi:hypothetical protein
MGDEAFLFGVTVGAGHGAQLSGDRGRRPTLGFELATEGLHVATATGRGNVSVGVPTYVAEV